MKNISRISLLLTTACLWLAAVSSLGADDARNRPLQPTSRIEVIIPANLRGLLLDQPAVTFLVSVDENGKLVEHMPIGATHYKLLEAAVRSLLEAKFDAARQDGVAVGSTGQVAVFFYDPNQRAYFQGLINTPYAGNPGDVAERRLYLIAKDQYVFRRSKPSELDHPIEVTETRIMLFTDKSGQPARGRCEVEYWIDPTGAVRFPRILQSDSDAVSTSALLTLQKTKFVPPTHRQCPTYVQVRQPLEFNTEAPPEKVVVKP